MSIVLKKSGSVNLTKKEPSLTKILVGLGWEFLQPVSIDIDASVFMLNDKGKLPADEYFIFYNNLKSPDGAVQHTGDNRSGIGEGDDEMILANLPLIDSQITELLFVVTIHEAAVRRQNFGMLKDAYIRLLDVATNREVLRYDLDEQFKDSTEVEFGKLRRQHGDWYFIASGIGTTIGLQGYVDRYI
ncbi:MAG: TerD family protein [Flammeovirgaceae bacterium]|nr:TerD family protein [Flammeovirgaceae bacterium]MDW8288521.1 TerD family protein [Flammeovirgaceae bacterium]